MAQVWPIGPDYYFFYRPTAANFLNGTTRLYDDPAIEMYNAPWLVPFLIPLALLPLRVGQAALTVASLVLLLTSISLLQRRDKAPLWAIVMALANLHTFDLLIRGQIDALILLGLVIGWLALLDRKPWLLGLGFWLLALKPPNVILPSLLMLYGTRAWTWRERGIALAPALLSIPLSGLFIGFDWPARYLYHYTHTPPNDYLNITLWHMADYFGWPHWPFMALGAAALVGFGLVVRREGVTTRTFSMAVLLNLIFAAYANGNHYVLLIPVLLYVARLDWRWAAAAYLLTWTPPIRALGGFDLAWVDIFYPVALLAAVTISRKKRN
ncbi:MAG: DUF2029 domain-containing protein, partial [Anaerolineae bacterium]|nr:DUF2029 domain-containing protein [Anaerolineae bacterium]